MELDFGEDLAVPAHFLIVDDHPLFLEALQRAIASVFPEASTVEATSIEAAKAELQKKQSFDIVLLDLALPGTRGFDGLLELRTLHPKTPIVVVSALEDPRIVHDVMSYGAAGFISKSASREEIGKSLKDVMDGSLTLPKGYRAPEPAAPGTRGDFVTRLQTLTPKQLSVLKMLRQGLAEQADCARAANRRDDGQGPRLGNFAQADCCVAHAGRDRSAEDRLR